MRTATVTSSVGPAKTSRCVLYIACVDAQGAAATWSCTSTFVASIRLLTASIFSFSQDDPTSKKWCSLCGPKFNADIEVNLYSRASKDIVALAQAVPSLSTLVAAVVAGNLTSVLSSPGPFTVFAPNNDAFDKLPAATLKHVRDQELCLLSHHPRTIL
jgi:hypothetical protein